MATTLNDLRHEQVGKGPRLGNVDRAIARRVQLIRYLVHFNQPNFPNSLVDKYRFRTLTEKQDEVLNYVHKNCRVSQ